MNNLKFRLVIEFAILCLILPSIIILFKLAPKMFFFLWAVAIICWFLYKHTPDRQQNLWKWDCVSLENLKPILIRFIISVIGMLIFIYFYAPEKMFGFIKYKPELWSVVMFVYPIVSALPQEFIFCTFFFARFKPLFGNERNLIIASSIVFAYAHVLYINPVAPILSLFGGYIFASTYTKHKSLALVTIEHALYGNALFTIGLGYYFYGGAVK
jgi:uncharacterized membrane protein YqhA